MDIIDKPKDILSKVRFIYKKPEGHMTHYANGAYGSITPRGDFEFNFFFEHRDVPEEEVMKVEEGELKAEEQKYTDIKIIRDIKVGIIMTVEQAESLGKWLTETVDEFKKNRENENV